MYESDITKFMREFLKKHPEEVASQRAGRGVWWDKTAAERASPAAMSHSPKAGGNEATFAVADEVKKDEVKK